jgi:hypothetical protein
MTMSVGQPVEVENLIGSLRVRGDKTDGKMLLEARVIVEAETKDAARSLSEAIAFESADGGERSTVRVSYPVGRYSAFRLPRSEKNGLMAKWVNPLVRKSTVATVYQGQPVEIGPAKGAAAVAVHLEIVVPMEIEATFRQVAGTLHAVGIRGDFSLEAVQSQILAEQVYGTLQARTGGGEVIVRKFGGELFRLQTASGDVSLIDVTADRAELRTGAGRIEGSGITTASLSVESGAGGVQLADVDSVSLDVDSESGGVDVAARITRTREASIVASSGDVTLRVNRASPFELRAVADAGSVKHRDLAAEVVDEEKNSVHLMRGSGGCSVQVRTGKGEVMIREI